MGDFDGKRMAVAITGASGVQLGYRTLQALRQQGCEIHLVVSNGAKAVIQAETDLAVADFESLADFCYDEADMAAPIASGTFPLDGMVVVPCSMKTLSGIANAYDENLCIRAADVCLKEGRRVVLVAREAPLRLAHLRNMLAVAEEGCVVLPPVMSFYSEPCDIEGQIDHIVGKVLAQFGLEHSGFHPWVGAHRASSR